MNEISLNSYVGRADPMEVDTEAAMEKSEVEPTEGTKVPHVRIGTSCEEKGAADVHIADDVTIPQSDGVARGDMNMTPIPRVTKRAELRAALLDLCERQEQLSNAAPEARGQDDCHVMRINHSRPTFVLADLHSTFGRMPTRLLIYTVPLGVPGMNGRLACDGFGGGAMFHPSLGAQLMPMSPSVRSEVVSTSMPSCRTNSSQICQFTSPFVSMLPESKSNSNESIEYIRIEIQGSDAVMPNRPMAVEAGSAARVTPYGRETEIYIAGAVHELLRELWALAPILGFLRGRHRLLRRVLRPCRKGMQGIAEHPVEQRRLRAGRQLIRRLHRPLRQVRSVHTLDSSRCGNLRQPPLMLIHRPFREALQLRIAGRNL
ncbi:hypothetical protein LTR53_003415 [Teratosphaeriaceae sp. CCFEE 6253]|nr:hypothetical protein LTR53_003415 [Teratosphaeriaceae sp. CCFEE 6253]